MVAGLVFTTMALVWVLTSFVLNRAFEQAGRAIVLDDLGEYEVLYLRVGAEGMKKLFSAGKHDRDQFLRVVDASGAVILEVLPARWSAPHWPDLSNQRAPAVGLTTWGRMPLHDGSTLTIGRRKLADGTELWFGRSNAADLEAMDRLHGSISLSVAIVASLAIAPLVWFSKKVLRPVYRLIDEARLLARSDSPLQKLETSAGIPELKEFAAAFNDTLLRVHTLTEELEAANDQLAHELRTPLARIRGNIEELLRFAAHPSARDSAVRALAEIDRAAQLVQTILSVRAGDARSMKLQMEPISLVDLIKETCELYSAAADAATQDLVIRVPKGDSSLLGDRQRLQQALCNLLDNALAYTPAGGRVEVALTREAGCELVTVRDTGPGLTQNDQDRIWRRFMRGSAASASTPGIGLGLSLVRAVVRAHGGEAGARNRPEGGAEFWIRLPARDPAGIVESAHSNAA